MYHFASEFDVMLKGIYPGLSAFSADKLPTYQDQVHYEVIFLRGKNLHHFNA